MKTELILTFTSPDRPGVVEDLTELVVACGGNWEESKLARLCGDFAGIARISLDDAQVPSFNQALAELKQKGILAHCRPSSPLGQSTECLSAELTCSGADHEGIVSRVAGRLAGMGINVEEMETSIEAAPTTGIPLFSMNCQLRIPESCDPEALRNDLAILEQELAVEIELKLQTPA